MNAPTIFGVKIIGIGMDDLGPETILTNSRLAEELLERRKTDMQKLGVEHLPEAKAKLYETNDEWIRQRVQIRHRRIAPAAIATSDLAIQAGRNALAHAKISPDAIGSIRLATVTPDELASPPTVSRVATGLGIPVWDIEDEELHELIACDHMYACSSFLAAFQDAVSDIMLGRCKYALVIGADKMSTITDWGNRDFCTILGDGGGAIVLKQVPYDQTDILVNAFFSGGDGSKAEKIIAPVGGSRRPLTRGEFENDPLLANTKLQMDGNRVYKDLVRILRKSIIPQALEKGGHTPKSIDVVFPHQANGRMSDEGIEGPLRELGFSGIVSKTIEEFGNTTSASVPIGMKKAYDSGVLRPSRSTMIAVMGGGYSWRVAFLNWSLS